MKIIRTNRYKRDMERIGASLEDMERLEHEVAETPTAGVVVQGLRGIRKIRFRLGERGKRGGGRAIYYLMLADEVAVMLAAYAKNDKADLSSSDRKAILALLKEFT
jgi:hypothetical protein